MNNIDGATHARVKQWLEDGYDQQTVSSVYELCLIIIIYELFYAANCLLEQVVSEVLWG